MRASVVRGTIVSFDSADWMAMVMLDGSPGEIEMPVGEWVQAAQLAADDQVAVLLFQETNYENGVILGPFGSTGLQNLHTAASPTFASPVHTGNLISYKNSTNYTGYIFVPLTTPLTSTSYDGNDTIAVGTTTIDTSAVFGAPVGIKAALVRVQCSWAAAAAGTVARLTMVGGSPIISIVRAHDTFFQETTVPVPCDSNGDFDLVVAGVQALNFTMQIWGYWI